MKRLRAIVALWSTAQGNASIVANTPFVLRRAREADARAIVLMVQRELIPCPRLSWWKDTIADEGSCFVVEPPHVHSAALEEPVLGVVATRICSAEYGLPARGHVSVCVVRTGYQGKGCGSMLLEHACRVLYEEKGLECTSLFVRCSNERALRFYLQRHHFTIHTRVASYYLAAGGLPEEDAFLLVRRWGQQDTTPVTS